MPQIPSPAPVSAAATASSRDEAAAPSAAASARADAVAADGRFWATTVSFAQRSGRLKDRQVRTWDALAPTFVVDPPRGASRASVDAGYVLDVAGLFGRDAPLVVEVGSGQGEALAHAAEAHPERNFLGLEVYRPGVVQTLQRIRSRGLTNVRLMEADAVDALTTMLPAGSVEELWVFFPDPWHKQRHHKRRLVSEDFVALAARVLRPGGTWRLATDWAEYADQMRAVIGPDPAFESDLFAPRFEGRVLTSFERKGLAKHREIADLACVRTTKGPAAAGPSVPLVASLD